jgi:hypothetical protein
VVVEVAAMVDGLLVDDTATDVEAAVVVAPLAERAELEHEPRMSIVTARAVLELRREGEALIT